MTTIARAPGKIVLSGEYAVLDGAPAISMAVNRYAEAVLRPAKGSTSTVAAPAISCSISQFSENAGTIMWQEGHDRFAVLDSVWRAAQILDCPDYDIELDSSLFFDASSQQKIGLGSSAAVTVSLTAALCPNADTESIARTAQRAHSNLQKGAGSGVDIATSVYGGLIKYQMAGPGLGSGIESLHWPVGLVYRVLWTGIPSSTQEKLAILDTTSSKPSRVRLAVASEDMATAWQSVDCVRVLAAYRDYVNSLREFGVDHDLGIFDAGHDELMRRAFAAGLVYKPCGAGGGDIGVLLGTSDALLDKFVNQMPDAIRVLDCELSDSGFEVTVAGESACE